MLSARECERRGEKLPPVLFLQFPAVTSFDFLGFKYFIKLLRVFLVAKILIQYFVVFPLHRFDMISLVITYLILLINTSKINKVTLQKDKNIFIFPMI